MYLPPMLVKIAHEQKLKDLGLDEPNRKSRYFTNEQGLSWVGDYHDKKKRSQSIRHFFSWNPLMGLFRFVKAIVLQWIHRNHGEESCEVPILSCTQNTVDCGD